MSTDLFGSEITKAAPIAPGLPTKRKPTAPKGYAAPPGSGPAGETCKTCEHYCRVGGHSKNYRKCGLCEKNWTNGPGTDIKSSAPACRFWKAVSP
ncbi:MAG TPA: hypothetical protein VMQ76_09410 [Terracidiphilus sp.]|nr:hypothetical protein [Terracidiphilus sp.]